jgi:hypothetical protein
MIRAIPPTAPATNPCTAGSTLATTKVTGSEQGEHGEVPQQPGSLGGQEGLLPVAAGQHGPGSAVRAHFDCEGVGQLGAAPDPVPRAHLQVGELHDAGAIGIVEAPSTSCSLSSGSFATSRTATVELPRLSTATRCRPPAHPFEGRGTSSAEVSQKGRTCTPNGASPAGTL